MKKTCLIVRGKQQDDVHFRPGTASPDKHWAYHLLDSFSIYEPKQHRTVYPEGICIHWGGNEEPGLSVRITSELWKNDEPCFVNLMNFIRKNNLTYEFPCEMAECDTCEGHPNCIANDHRAKAADSETWRCEECPRAA